ncbi:MAG TPA: gamma-glutamyl-gamma-aminobutyrate hydrolase family protein [Streptosporangiaceae bacterium]|nr:gamma-glutamyl-gamma-aminobutyrate hydrolase family protein [Streptosporangiaceae bacterium]
MTSGPEHSKRCPVIGISAYSEVARWRDWELPATLLPQNYADQVAAAGGVPVLLPPVPGVEQAIGQLDGLVISGGPDIAPDRYGERPGPHTTITRPERDAAELALLRAALGAPKPVLGICRGMQLMNVALGGTLIQHLPDVVGHEGHAPNPAGMGEHKVTVARSGRLAAIIGSGAFIVPTHHHQAVAALAPGLIATAVADDGTIEAVELDPSAGHPFAVAVQWHPEAGDDLSLFRALVAAALSPTGS